MEADEDKISRLAEAELLQEAKRAAVRYSVSGPSGWLPCPLSKTNKTFLMNTLKQTVDSNRIRDKSKLQSHPRPPQRKLFKGRQSHGYCEDNIVFSKPSKTVKNPSPSRSLNRITASTSKMKSKKKHLNANIKSERKQEKSINTKDAKLSVTNHRNCVYIDLDSE